MTAAATKKRAPNAKAEAATIAVVEHVVVDLPQRLQHKGQAAVFTGRVAIEVELPDGSKAWVRRLSPGGRVAKAAASVKASAAEHEAEAKKAKAAVAKQRRTRTAAQ
jgi:hypothetical protein